MYVIIMPEALNKSKILQHDVSKTGRGVSDFNSHTFQNIAIRMPISNVTILESSNNNVDKK